MKKTALILSCLLLSASALAENSVSDAVNGKRLYEENPDKCLRCHANGEQFSVTEERQPAQDITKLESWVRNCDVRFKTNWFDDEILDVVAYLNQQYYKFPADDAEKAQTEGTTEGTVEK